MQVTDSISLGICPKTIATSGDNLIERSKNGMIIYCLANASLTNVILRFDIIAGPPSYSVNLAAGTQLLGVKSCSIASGQVEVFYLK